MEPWMVLLIFPSAAVVLDERLPLDLQNDFEFVLEYIKNLLISPKIIQPNQRIKSAIKAVNSYGLQMLDVCTDLLRTYITSLEFTTVESISDSYFSTVSKCGHLANVLQFNYQQSQLLLRCCSSTFQSYFMELKFMDQIAIIFKQTLFSGSNENLVILTELLRSLSLTENLEEVIIDLTTEYVSQKVSQELMGNFRREIVSLLQWSSSVVYPILQQFLPPDEFDISMLHEVIRYEVVKLRTQEIFDMVSHFPESTRALNELRISINSQHQRENVVNSFCQSCNTKLLHAGTDTIKIIQYYMKTVRSFLVIDPRGVLLDKACRPIRKYLRTRDDTVDRIVNGLLDTNEDAELGELSEELYNTKTNSIDVDDINDINWTPDPIDALPDFRKRKVGDLVESLFSIFDTKSVFLTAFLKRFSNDLSKLTDYDVRQVVTSLNFLKLRFGDEDFNSIDVMIQDILQSAKVDRIINPGLSSFHTSIISHLYWPLDDYVADQPAPQFLKPIFEQYSAKFSEIKQGRKLKLIPSLGTVDLDLEFANGEVQTFSVTPDKASVVYAFSEKTELSVEQLMKELFIDGDDLEEILKFWVDKEVLHEISPQIYAVNENKEKSI